MTLDLRNSTQISTDIFKCDEIIRHCFTLENLDSLSVLVNKYTVQKLGASKFISLPINRCIKKFKYENETRDNNYLLISMLQSLPNLNFIELSCDYDEDIFMQLPLMKNLKNLTLADYHHGLLKAIKCTEALECISVKYCKSSIFII